MITSSLISLCLLGSQPPLQPRVIRFSGYDWRVKSSEGKVGPGPNFFDGSEDSAFLDSKGRLHLKVRKAEKGWTSSEVVLSKSLGYGRYSFTLATQPKQLDDRVILGAFLYADDTREIDFELTRWGDAKAFNGQFVVQPYATEGNMERFEIPVEAPDTQVTIDWKPDAIRFTAKASGFQKSWSYKGKDNFTPGDERFIFNLWLMQGKPPTMEKEYEVIISKFGYSKQ